MPVKYELFRFESGKNSGDLVSGVYVNKAVVTGASGFLGSRLVQRLVSDGVAVTPIVRQPTSDGKVADLTQPHVIDQFLTPDTTIFHLAASANVPASIIDPVSDFRNT